MTAEGKEGAHPSDPEGAGRSKAERGAGVGAPVSNGKDDAQGMEPEQEVRGPHPPPGRGSQVAGLAPDRERPLQPVRGGSRQTPGEDQRRGTLLPGPVNRTHEEGLRRAWRKILGGSESIESYPTAYVAIPDPGPGPHPATLTQCHDAAAMKRGDVEAR